MPLRYVTLLVMAAVFVGIVVYDSVVAATDVRATISALTAQWALRHTISVFVLGMSLGILFGHLFWYQTPTLPAEPATQGPK
jgi:hypothetical protein